jgi:hypothetical protein
MSEILLRQGWALTAAQWLGFFAVHESGIGSAPRRRESSVEEESTHAGKAALSTRPDQAVEPHIISYSISQ